MSVPRPDDVLNLILLDTISNMGLSKNFALAHAFVSLGSKTLEDVSWLTVDDALPYLCIPSLDNPHDTMELGITHYRGVQFMFYVSKVPGSSPYGKISYTYICGHWFESLHSATPALLLHFQHTPSVMVLILLSPSPYI